MRGTNKDKPKINSWPMKAKSRAKEIAQLKKRVKELCASRDNWKGKYKSVKLAFNCLKKEHRKLNNSTSKSKEVTEKPKHHSFSTTIILLCICLRQQGNCSLRCCSKMLGVIAIVLELELNFPSANTIQNWEKKLGHYRLNSKERKNSRWAIIIDESIIMGEAKLLLTIGVDLDEYEFGQSLDFSKISVIDMSISKKALNGEDVCKRISELKDQGITIDYCVSDGVGSLVRGLRLSGIARIPDCSHVIGNLLKNQYEKNEDFIKASGLCGMLRRDVYTGKDTVIMPPKKRKKGRFLNLSPMSKWACKMLDLLENKASALTEGQRKKLAWLLDYDKLFREIRQHCKVMEQVSKILKKEGLSEASAKKAKQVFNKFKTTDFFKNGIVQYLEDSLTILETHQPVICCSDVIESMFGKYKNLLSSSTKKMINDNCLAIPNFSKNFNRQEIKEAMETTKIADLLKWKEKNSPCDLNIQQRKLLKNTG